MSFRIETERLILRDIREEDLPTLIAQSVERESLKNVLANQRTEAHNKVVYENALAWAKTYENQILREHYKLAVELKTDWTLIGSCTITPVKSNSYETSIGWHYGYQYRNNGYATEVASELLHIGFELNNVRMIFADCFPDNKASIRVMEKIGMNPFWNFSLFNTLRGWSYGESRATVRHIITKNQWLANKNR